VVEDEARIADLICTSLEGHDVSTARDGGEAIELLRQQEFDLVLCDIVMQPRSGVDVYEAVSELRPAMKERFVFMSGGAFTERAQAFLTSVPNEVLEKPFTLQELTDVVARALGTSS
jgi:CheY-like chemotaxis protein